jgi:hypothetical protein
MVWTSLIDGRPRPGFSFAPRDAVVLSSSLLLRAALLARGLLPPNKTCPLSGTTNKCHPQGLSFCLAGTNPKFNPPPKRTLSVPSRQAETFAARSALHSACGSCRAPRPVARQRRRCAPSELCLQSTAAPWKCSHGRHFLIATACRHRRSGVHGFPIRLQYFVLRGFRVFRARVVGGSRDHRIVDLLRTVRDVRLIGEYRWWVLDECSVSRVARDCPCALSASLKSRSATGILLDI